ncbi:extracellular solute-binding protein [Bradyrhizobium sp. 17]|uniref:extracellular solute-binding protein n=1 Tax=Bradyrhizobium sp. 17 TaxID=2782649 RepID=UPI0021114C59|nr:extracellular solute-binding protein [Bradyrhizobium sp. 17]MCK1520113.1 extracellular solute-binding protein [Bradyrhizobium sp. 17]
MWDVFDAGGPAAYAGAKEGFWESVDPKLIDPARFVRKRPPFAVPTAIYTGGIAYDPSRTKYPASDFGQFWDITNFPGRRALRSLAEQTLEPALLADGVAPGELYPLDVKRAFTALDRIKPHTRKWFAATAEGVKLIQTNEVDYTITFANRVRAAKESGVSIDFSFGQCFSETQYFTVVRGSPRKEAAMLFLEFVTRPEQQVLIGNKLGAIPVTKGAEQQLNQQARRWLPDPNNPKNVLINDEYWADHFVELDKRFKEWILT